MPDEASYAALMVRVLLVLSLVSGCQCLVPVDEHPDAGGSDGGSDAGPDAGATCTRPADCIGSAEVIGWCSSFLGGSADGGFSCVDGHCVVQCAAMAGQTCAQDRGVECLRCPPTTSCIPPSCGGGLELTYTVAQLICRGRSELSLGDRVREGKSMDGGCGLPLFHQASIGEVYIGELYLQSARRLSARIESLGGTCLVSDLPTGASRLMLDCPLCQVGLGP